MEMMALSRRLLSSYPQVDIRNERKGSRSCLELSMGETCPVLLGPLVADSSEVPYPGRGRQRRETFASTFLQPFRAAQACG